MSWKYNPAEVDVLNNSGPLDLGAEILTAARSLVQADNGKTFFLDLAGGFTVTLPASCRLGTRFNFVVKTAPTTAYIVACPAAATLIKGHVLTSATALADSGTAGENALTFVAASAVAGDRATLICDGTNWHVEACCTIAASITIS